MMWTTSYCNELAGEKSLKVSYFIGLWQEMAAESELQGLELSALCEQGEKAVVFEMLVHKGCCFS